MINIEIDGKKLSVEPGEMIIEVADKAGIAIPRFCYHKKLSIAANCRMCLVEVENAPKPLPACATPVGEGMKVYTQSEKTIEAQKSVMEFLLINHPLDCPICDQGGECELQDVAMGYGEGVSRFTEGKRTVKDKDIGPLIATELTRCIHCTRCVRFGEEVAGIQELGAVQRGEHMKIATYIEGSVDSELSGNVIDLCPVGALTSKPFRFSARAWEMQQRPTIAPHDGVGSHLYLHVMGNQVKRVVPREAEAINETWIADRDRYSYESLHHADRVTKPLVKQEGVWKETDWSQALEVVAKQLNIIAKNDGADQIGCLASPSATLEEHYLLQKWLRALGCQNIDHRLRKTDFRVKEQAPQSAALPCEFTDVEYYDRFLLIGSYLRKDIPMLNHRVRKAVMLGAEVSVLNPVDYDFNFDVAHALISDVRLLSTQLAGILKALSANAPLFSTLPDYLRQVSPDPAQQAVADSLKAGEKVMLFLGSLALHHPEAGLLKALAEGIAKETSGELAFLHEGANAVGARLAGAMPHVGAAGSALPTPGLDAAAMTHAPRKAYVLHQIEPEWDCAYSAQTLQALEQAEFVVALNTFQSDTMLDYADVILPAAAFTETSGTYVNLAGHWQSFEGAVVPQGEARPAWKILRVLANLHDVEGFDYTASTEVRDELKQQVEESAAQSHEVAGQTDTSSLKSYSASRDNTQQGLVRLTETPLYRTDAFVRRSPALQQTTDNQRTGVRVSRQVAEQYKLDPAHPVTLQQGDYSVSLPWQVDEALPGNHVWTAGVAGLGAPFGAIELTQGKVS